MKCLVLDPCGSQVEVEEGSTLTSQFTLSGFSVFQSNISLYESTPSCFLHSVIPFLRTFSYKTRQTFLLIFVVLFLYLSPEFQFSEFQFFPVSCKSLNLYQGTSQPLKVKLLLRTVVFPFFPSTVLFVHMFIHVVRYSRVSFFLSNFLSSLMKTELPFFLQSPTDCPFP